MIFTLIYKEPQKGSQIQEVLVSSQLKLGFGRVHVFTEKGRN